MPAIPTPIAGQYTISYSGPSLEALGRVVRAHNRAIRACESCDHSSARETIGLLRAALALDSQASRGLDALYAWCETTVDGRDFIGPARTLRSLREAWYRAGAIAPRAEWPVS